MLTYRTLPAIGAIWWIILAIPLNAQYSNQELTLGECIRRAFAAPGAVTRARSDLNIAQAGVASAKASFLPQSQIVSAFTYNSPASQFEQAPTTGSFIALNGVREYQAFGSVVAEIDTSGRLRAALARAHADRTAAESAAVISQRDLKRAVTSAYYRLLLSRHLVQAEQDLLNEAQSFYRKANDLFSAGESARVDLVKATAQVARFRGALLAAQAEARMANYDLASFWTPDVSTEIKLVDNLSERQASQAPIEAQPFLKRPEYVLFSAEEAGFKADARRVRATLYPQLGIAFDYGIDANRIAWNDRGNAVMASLTIPLFDWFRARNDARQYTLRADQIRMDREAATRNFSRDYQTAKTQVETIASQIDAAGEQVNEWKQNLTLARLRYEGGESPALEIVDAENQLAQAQVDYYTLLFNYKIANADLEVATGR